MHERRSGGWLGYHHTRRSTGVPIDRASRSMLCQMSWCWATGERNLRLVSLVWGVSWILGRSWRGPILWDFDATFHVMYRGTAAIRIYRRTQDTGRKGHYPRLGKASNIEWDLVLRLRSYAERHSLLVSERCSKGADPGAWCRHCPPFFFAERVESRGGPKVREQLSRQMASAAVTVKKSLQLIGVDTTHFSGMSMRRGRRGGISADLTARVPAPVLYLQSGHGGKMAAQNYMVSADPSVWFENFAALQL